MLEVEARIPTTEASRYLTELALAWVHTYPVRYDAITAEVELPGGELVMTAGRRQPELAVGRRAGTSDRGRKGHGRRACRPRRGTRFRRPLRLGPIVLTATATAKREHDHRSPSE